MMKVRKTGTIKTRFGYG